jgi:hypothetical protein
LQIVCFIPKKVGAAPRPIREKNRPPPTSIGLVAGRSDRENPSLEFASLGKIAELRGRPKTLFMGLFVHFAALNPALPL